MKATFFEATESERAALTNLPSGIDTAFYSEKLSSETANLAKDSEIVSVFINSQINKEVLDLLPNLKLLQTRSTGYDHIDLASAKDKGVSVANIPGYGSHTVAEFAFALLLSLSRKIFWARHQLLESDNFDVAALQGTELRGKTIGVVGTGRIGKNVVKIANGFEMKVVACDVLPDEEFAAEQKFEYVDLPTLLGRADIVTLHAPYNEQSHHLLNKGNIPTMKKGAFLINTARGELVETDALLKALESGALAGAGLDVLEGERQLKDEAALLRGGAEMADYKTLFEDHVLMDMPNVVLTPHIAFNSKEGLHEILEITAETLINFAAGKPENLL